MSDLGAIAFIVVGFFVLIYFLRGVATFALHPIKGLMFIVVAGFIIDQVSRLIGMNLTLIAAIPTIMLMGHVLRNEDGPSTASFLGSITSSKPSKSSSVDWRPAPPGGRSDRAAAAAEEQRLRDEATYLRHHADQAAHEAVQRVDHHAARFPVQPVHGKYRSGRKVQRF